MSETRTNQYINRELSWLQFNARVLQEAADDTVPLVERLRFIGIFSNNLDEFFKVRYATIKRIDLAGKDGKNVLKGTTASNLLEKITNIVIKQQAESLKTINTIKDKLEQHDIFIINENQVTQDQDAFIRNYFVSKVSPALVTYILNDLDKFPHLKDSVAYLAVKLVLKQKVPKEGRISKILQQTAKERIYALIEIPKNTDRFVVLPKKDGKQYIIILDDLIRYCMHINFSIFDYVSASAHMIKITRDAQLDFDNDLSKSFIQKISSSVKSRRDGEPVRFVYDKHIEKDTLDFLMKKMGVDNTDSIIPGGKYHNRRDYMSFPDLGNRDLIYHPITPLAIPGLALQGSLLDKIAKKDFLQYTPYHTFSYTVKFLREAAIDPKVKSIKITIYRLASISHIASSLINAAKNSKRVTVQIELQARFDEAANIRYAEKMQREGVNLIFGVTGLKVHCKACVIEREEKGKLKRYGFISTGNFNESTARIYTDYTLFTTNESILKETNKVFKFFEINYKINRYKHLLVSPHYTRSSLIKLIDKEIKNVNEGKPAGIRLKLNSLSDYDMIDKLYEASRAGVKIDLIIRGICCLIPGIPGMSENIRAISVVDKFLEHPRLFIFTNAGDVKVYISSADWMTRNLDRRVEISCPIYDKDIKEELMDTFDICWNDNVKGRRLSKDQDNAYIRNDKDKVRSQIATYDYYLKKLAN
ncbi:polyphosphate kinase 1 [Aquimarina sp. AD10]|uniref:Polyphosphate kinase n=1 Tax=Aquimarina aggregata TaxID=1642818 RepID=A0A163CAR3_9FLAO|nr:MULTISPECIES: polyphosphate kinase 1 [Aquimarina]AXT59787.1 polyphosphate kinase 1 [Aquimarina sp. AD10]KZS42226.1 polyphosphate kinase [Aquimarina aggregata]RKM97657.1 polyphosphate kinase 1 [Aquimarina sp. AD10]